MCLYLSKRKCQLVIYKVEDVIIVHSSVEEHNTVKCQDNLYSSQGKTFSTSARDSGFSEKNKQCTSALYSKKNGFQSQP